MGIVSQSRRSTLLRAGDSVVVIAGGNKRKNPIKGSVGKILSFVGADRVVVEGVNFRLRYQKPTALGQPGGPVRAPSPVHISNVMYYSSELKRGVRLKVVVGEDGVKKRVFRNPSSKEFVAI
jgi:ribosomal protein L24